MHRLRKPILAAVAALILLSSIVYSAKASAEWSGSFTAPGNNTITASLPVKPAAGDKVWSANVGNNTVAIVGDYVYTYDGLSSVGAYDQNATLYKLDRDTGSIVASSVISSTSTLNVGSAYYYSYIIYADGTLFVGTPRAIQAFDPDSLSRKWIYSLVSPEAYQSGQTSENPTPVYATIQYINGYIISNGTVLNAADGTLAAKLSKGKWSGKNADTTVVGGLANGAEKNGLYYVADATESLYVFDTTTWACVDEYPSGLNSYTSAPGVLYYDGALYWGGVSKNARMIRLTTDGKLDTATFKRVNAGLKCYGAPVAANGRVYLAGMTDTGQADNTGEARIRVFNAANMNTVYTVSVESASKIQSTPILSSYGEYACIYVQSYASPGKIYALMDKAGQTTGRLTTIITPEISNYAWGQLACDDEGALFFSNDAFVLWKYEIRAAYGDADGNGDLGLGDLNLLRRYLAGQDVKPNSAADVNCDGIIDANDLIILNRHMAHWDDYETLPINN